MCLLNKSLLLMLLLGAGSLLAAGQSTALPGPPAVSVIHYDVMLEPDIPNKSIKGSMIIQVASRGNDSPDAIEFDCGDLTVDSVREGRQALQYVQANHQIRIILPPSAKAKDRRSFAIEYHGAPKRGIRFFPDRMQIYTVFSTSQWMICIDDPNERATLRTRLIVPAGLTTVGNGRLIARKPLANGKFKHEWRQDRPVPSYTFGFVAGRFRTVTERREQTQLAYLGEQFTAEQLHRIFRDTADMIKFYEDRSGVKYPGTTYTQVLAAGGVEQEMAGFTALRETYGKDVLANERKIWLGAHELAHQWWGIEVGCRAWTHFWLNEGMATFMADAYKEQRFGRNEYLKEIGESRKLYEKVRDAGKDGSLVFPDWLHPTAEDRTLVYDKGAYVLHLLREEMGEKAFWSGLRSYTRKYFGKSVTTADFQAAMQQATDKDLSAFFNKWVYFGVR